MSMEPWGGSRILESSGCMRTGKCPMCGQTFAYTAAHAWRVSMGNKRTLLCSYTCMRRAQAENRERRKRPFRPRR